MASTRFGLLFAILCVVVGGCSSGRRAEPIEIAACALDRASEDAAADPMIMHTEYIPDSWWELFGDPQLTSFILTTFERNPTLQEARAHVMLSAFGADSVRANLFPMVNWGGDILREKFSETGLIPFVNPASTAPAAGGLPAQGGSGGIPVYFTQYETELTLAYNFDIWGKNRNTYQAALGQVQADIADEVFTRLQLGIAVAQVYYQLQIDYRRRYIAQRLIHNLEKFLELTRGRVKGNLENSLSIPTAESRVSDAKSALLQIEGDIAVKEHQLRAFLAGDFEEEICPMSISEKYLPAVPLPCDIPMHLLSNRPDIIRQLWLIESAGRQIEVAQAGFYPDFNITGLFGYQTLHLSKLFEWPSSYFNVDPAFTLPIFDGGRLIANLGGSEVNYDLAILEYNNLIINAVKEVLDGIAVLRNAEQQLQELKNKLHFQEEHYSLTNLRIAHNLNSDLDALVSEQSLIQARDQETVALGNTIQAALSLIKAIGGSYYAK